MLTIQVIAASNPPNFLWLSLPGYDVNFVGYRISESLINGVTTTQYTIQD